MRKLNELEGVAVGIIHKRQPCTAYALRMELKLSPSSHWRASAGAIYPLLSRLADDGLLKSTDDPEDRRGRKLLTTTPAGRRALKAWIREIANPDLLSELFDPLRTRIFFLGALTNKEQTGFAETVLGALDDHLASTRQYLLEKPPSGDLFEHLGAIGGVINAQSRIELLKTVLARIHDNQKTTRRDKAADR